MNDLIELTEEEWFDTFKPIPNHIDEDASFNDGDQGYMFETYGKELEYVLSIANTEPNRVWTYMDGDVGTFIGDGYHLVNRIGYFITEVPNEENSFVEVSIDEYEEYEDEEV